MNVEVIPVDRQAFAAIITERTRPPWIFASVYARTDRLRMRELCHILGRLVDKKFSVCFVGDSMYCLNLLRSVEGPSLNHWR